MELFFGLLIAITVGYFISKDANERGMNGMAWGICSAMLMIIVVPLYLIVRKPRKSPVV
jgi:hypothetical protein